MRTLYWVQYHDPDLKSGWMITTTRFDTSKIRFRVEHYYADLPSALSEKDENCWISIYSGYNALGMEEE